MPHAAWLLAAVFGVALIYASVGHGGASGYLAVLSLFGFNPGSVASSALCLNLLVSGLAFRAYQREGHFDARLFWPFAAASIPLAFAGGFLKVPFKAYAGLLAAALIAAALRLMLSSPKALEPKGVPRLPAALAAGGGIGLLSGVVGVGGGIFLSPLMILMRWADAKKAAAVSALFIFVNSLSGLAGQSLKGEAPLAAFWPLALAAFAGGAAGSRLGSRRLDNLALRRVLGVVLLLAALKLVRGAWA